MPLKITLHCDIIVPEEIMDQDEFEEYYKDDMEAMINFLDEDFSGFMEMIGSSESMVEGYEWITDDEVKELEEEENSTIH